LKLENEKAAKEKGKDDAGDEEDFDDGEEKSPNKKEKEAQQKEKKGKKGKKEEDDSRVFEDNNVSRSTHYLPSKEEAKSMNLTEA